MKTLGLLLLIFSNIGWSAKENVIFFQYANKAVLSKLHDNSYTLTLTKAPSYLSYFVTAPVKKSGMISLKQFICLWKNDKSKNNVVDNPPHAAISLVTQNGIFINELAVIANPSYVKPDLSYQITILNNKLLEMGELKNLVIIFDDILWDPSK